MHFQYGHERFVWTNDSGEFGPAEPALEIVGGGRQWQGPSNLEQRPVVPGTRTGKHGRGSTKGQRGTAGQGNAAGLTFFRTNFTKTRFIHCYRRMGRVSTEHSQSGTYQSILQRSNRERFGGKQRIVLEAMRVRKV